MYGLFLVGTIVNVSMADEELITLIGYVFNLLILSFTVVVVKKHRRSIENYYSDLELKTLDWIWIIVIIFIGFNLLWIVEDVLVIWHKGLQKLFAETSNVLTLFVVYWVGHNGFSQPEIFRNKLSVYNTNIYGNELEDTKKGDDKNIGGRDKWLFIDKIIKEKKLFVNPKLNLRSLSTTLEMNEKEISRLINQETEGNFYYYINQLRVAEFKNLMNSNKKKHFSLLGLAQEAGFNSKTTFYTAFKTFEGITPKQFEKTMKEKFM
jgi:AraC-like DNA-binding protein